MRQPVLLLGRPARHARDGAARQPVRDARRHRERLPLARRARASASPATPATASGARAGRSRSSHERGLLGPTQTYVHCNSLADDELKMMADRLHRLDLARHRVADGPRLAGDRALLEAGMRPSLSIDVCCSNGGHLFGTIRATIGTQRGFDKPRRARAAGSSELKLTCRDVLEFATIEGARAVRHGQQDRHRSRPASVPT